MLNPTELGHGDISSFYTCDEGLSALTQEGQATLERLEGMLAQSVAQQYHMAGVQTEQSQAEFQGWMLSCHAVTWRGFWMEVLFGTKEDLHLYCLFAVYYLYTSI